MDRILLAPFSFFYGVGVAFRNKMFDWGWIRSQEYDIPVVCVGNLTVGGTGKTPVTEFLVAHLRQGRKIAVLSRGYKRRSHGFLEVQVNTPFLDSGDEPKQIKLKFPEIIVAVCEKRVEGIARIREDHPDVDLIILDDGFQHRYVEPWVNIVLVDYTRPVYRDHMLPRGNLRDNISQLHRAHHVIITKCPPDMTAIDRRIVQKSLKLYPYQCLYFSTMRDGEIYPLFADGEKTEVERGGPVIGMSGIGNPAAFEESLGKKYEVVDTIEYPDHHPYRKRDLETMMQALDGAPEGTIIVTTEKDAVKLRNSKKIPEQLRRRLFCQPVEISFNDDSERDFLKRLENDVTTNPKHSLLHS